MNTDYSKLQNSHNTEYAGVDILWAHEKNLANYHKNIVSKLSKYSDMKSEILEFGAGIGTLAKIWERVNKNKPECLEIDKKLRDILIGRGFTCYQNIENIKKEFDLIYTSNVLEHIEDDMDALRKINSKIKNNGYLAIYVPAFMFLYNRFDSSVGHYRRYDKKDLINKLLQTGFKIEQCYFVDSVGFFAWLSIKMKGQSDKSQLDSDKRLKIYDQFIYPISSMLDFLGLKYLFGKNLLVIARKF